MPVISTNRPGRSYETAPAPGTNGSPPPSPRPIADAAPLGLAAFALTTFVLSFFNAGILNIGGAPVVLGLALAYGGLAQLLVASFRTTAATNIVFLLLAVTLALLGIGNWAGVHGVVTAGGWAGIATAVAAWYASFAGVMNSTFSRTILPTRPLLPRAAD